MLKFAHDIAGGQGNLIAVFVQSPNFVHEVSGWQVARDGSAEFNNVTIRGGEIIGGTTLIYNGTPAHGNLVYSQSQSGGTDAFGNVYQAGAVSYESLTGTYTQLDGGQIAIFNPVAGGTAGLNISDSGVLVVSGTPGIISYQVTVPISQPLYASDPVAGFSTKETWHTITLDAGWSPLAGYAVPSYRVNTDGELRLTGLADFGSSQTANHNLNNGHPLPAPYRPLTNKVFRSQDGQSQRGAVQITPGGVIEFLASAAFPARYCEIDAVLPLNL